MKWYKRTEIENLTVGHTYYCCTDILGFGHIRFFARYDGDKKWMVLPSNNMHLQPIWLELNGLLKSFCYMH